ncbi:hypothetical protein LSTR_LSTR016895, partial [Laodelphax striatellus]
MIDEDTLVAELKRLWGKPSLDKTKALLNKIDLSDVDLNKVGEQLDLLDDMDFACYCKMMLVSRSVGLLKSREDGYKVLRWLRRLSLSNKSDDDRFIRN